MIPNNLKPSSWVKKVIENIEPGGSLIDIACGKGRHSVYLSQKFYVYAVDINNDHLNKLNSFHNLETVYQDLESDEEWKFSKREFNIVLVTNYLFREKILDLFKLVKLNGYIIYETFAIGNEKFGKPTNPKYLLKSEELLKIKPKNFETVEFFEDIIIENSKKSKVQRLLAKRLF